MYVTTKEGRIRRPTHYDNILEYPTFIVERSYIPEPWAGDPIAYNLRIRSEYGEETEYHNVPIYVSPDPKTIETYALVSSNTIIEKQLHPSETHPRFVIRFSSLIPYTNYTCWFSPITAAGPALVEGGPFHARTIQSVANQPPHPELYDSPRGEGFVMVNFRAPMPPFGIIIRYDIGVPNALDGLKFDVLYTTDDVSSTNVTISVDGIDATSIRVRAYTSVGAGPWSDRAVDMRTTNVKSSATILSTVALGISLGIVLPILAVLVIVVVWLTRRYREHMKHPAFPFPPPDRWEVDRTLLEFGELLGWLSCVFFLN
jgi:hypothetical protein